MLFVACLVKILSIAEQLEGNDISNRLMIGENWIFANFSGYDLTQTGTIFGAELSNIYMQHNLTVSDFKMNGNHCLSDLFFDLEFVLNE